MLGSTASSSASKRMWLLFHELWYGGHWGAQLLRPLAQLYCAGVQVRRWAYAQGWLASEKLPVPTIIVGNLSVGGTGKTPLVIWLAQALRQRGYRPGVLLRGYGGRAKSWPQWVLPEGNPDQFGDEAVLLAQRTGCPVVAGPDRLAAGRLLLQRGHCDLILCDDGLQHYRLQRDLEILVTDAQRGLGNGYCLPAGPLREPPDRAEEIALRVCTGGPCTWGVPVDLQAGAPIQLNDVRQTRPLAQFRGQRVTAVAGIGHPQRFFRTLRQAGLQIEPRPYPDHHRFRSQDLAAWQPPVLMTEKDAVKCRLLVGDRNDLWYVPVSAVPSPAFAKRFFAELDRLKHDKR